MVEKAQEKERQVMAKGGLDSWHKQKWVDISRKKKDGSHPPCGRKKASTSSKGYPKCVPSSKASKMSDSEKQSAVRRKRSKAQAIGGKPTNVATKKGAHAKRKK